MTDDEIARIAESLQCRPIDGVIRLARMVAEHCAELAEGVAGDDTAKAAAAAIREAFMARPDDLANRR